MASELRLGRIVQSWFLFLVLCLAQSPIANAQFCSFWNNGCIDPLAQTAVSFDFQPLFTDPIYLYYGFDASVSGKGEGPMTKSGFWLRYRDRHVNSDAIDNNRTSEIAMRVGNLTGVPSGSNNGCDGIWGADCSNDIKRSLQRAMFRLASSGHYYDRPLERALEEMMLLPPALPSCPPPILDVAEIPVQGMCGRVPRQCIKLTLPSDFAKERTPFQNVTVLTPGSSTSPWQVWYIDSMTAHQQASQVAVAIISRGPTYNSQPPYSPEEIQIELVCMQAPQSLSNGSNSND